jgi:hypothetical protein
MKKYILSLLSIAFISFLTSAQDCTPEILAKKAGTWKAGQQGSIHNVSATDLVKEKLVIAGIHQMVNTKYNPKGCQISYSNVYGKELGAGQNWIADPYHYSMYILRFICDGNSKDKSKYYVDYSTPTTVDITANVIFSLNNLYASNIPDDDFRGYLKLKQKPQKIDGYYFMGEEVVGDNGTAYEIKESRWLITYSDTLPFYYVSRKEYLLIQKKRLEKSIKENSGDKGYSNKFINNINEYLKMPEVELNKPAICMWNEEERFEKFVDEGTKGSFISVKPNLDYYHKKLPKSSPQFITVVYTLAAGDPVFEENISNIKKAVDFAVLKSMLGK